MKNAKEKTVLLVNKLKSEGKLKIIDHDLFKQKLSENLQIIVGQGAKQYTDSIISNVWYEGKLYYKEDFIFIMKVLLCKNECLEYM